VSEATLRARGQWLHAAGGDVLRHLLAVQAQALRTPSRALAVRGGSFRDGLVITWLMRQTLHLVWADDLEWLHPLFAPRMAAVRELLVRELGVSEAEEPHDTFLENALAKARHASAAAGLPALADDSGLCVPALGGAPGVHSAYYAGRDGEREVRDARNNALLLENLSGKDRKAYYVCTMVLVRNPQDPKPLVAEGRWHGEIGLAPRGANGFGYDPLFLVPELRLTAAELDPEHKNRISHRARAAARLLELLRDGARA